MPFKHRIGLVLGLTVVLMGVIGFLITPACRHLYCLELKDVSDYSIQDVYEKSPYVFRALYSKGSVLLRVDIRSEYSKNDAESSIQAKIAMTQGAFENMPAPYPSDLSNIIACGEEFKPGYHTREQHGIEISYFDGFLNDRLVLGSCAQEDAAYHLTSTLLYCEQQERLYQLEIIIPADEYASRQQENEEIVRSIACK